MAAIVESPDNRVQAFLAAGHVCSVMGYWQYQAFVDQYHVPVAVTGFEPIDVLLGIRNVVEQLEAGRAELSNAYERAVTFPGNESAQTMLSEVFEVTDRTWRGIGEISKSGWRLRDAFRAYDAEEKFAVSQIHTVESQHCHSGDVLRGRIKPNLCPAFGKECTPRTPLGATMVSSEGACAAYYLYGRYREQEVA
jgi:hydrogenase expression/formation protein HypD